MSDLFLNSYCTDCFSQAEPFDTNKLMRYYNFQMKLIFSDLDGSFLDHNTYCFKAAKGALKRIKALAIPLLICTSKTKDEIELYKLKMGIDFPFIAENGGAIYIPKAEHKLAYKTDSQDERYSIIQLGVERSELREVFFALKKKLKVTMTALSEMTVKEIMDLTSLPENEAKLAIKRDFSEPFIISDIDFIHEESILSEFTNRGYTVVKGGRFYHLMGKTDKGAAVKKLTSVYEDAFGEEIYSLGLGDSENDLSMLEAVSCPVLIRKTDGSWLDSPGTKNYIRTRGIGLEGWNEAVLNFLAY